MFNPVGTRAVDSPTAELIAQGAAPPAAPSEGRDGQSEKSKRGKDLDAVIERFLGRYPRLAGAIGMLGAASLGLGYLATAAGHIRTLRTTIYVQFGEDITHAIHIGMLGLVVVLLLAGFTLGLIAIDRRFLKGRDARWRGGIDGSLAIVALSLTAWSAYLLAPDAPTTVAMLTDTSNRWRKDLLATQNQDGGLRYNNFEHDVESQAWTTAQALAAVLSRKDRLSAGEAAVVRAAFNFLDSVEGRAAGEGWGYFDYVPWDVTEINAWVTIALAKSIQHPSAKDIWAAELPTAKDRLQHCSELVQSRAMAIGAWAPVNDKSHERFSRTYSTLMSVWALLEVRRLQPSEAVDTRIERGIDWMLLKHDASVGGWVPNPSREKNLEGFPGLTSHTLYVLLLAWPDFKNRLVTGGFDDVLAQYVQWLAGAEIPPRKLEFGTRPVTDNDRMHDSDRYLYKSPRMVESSTFLWYPWTVMACKELERVHSSISSIKMFPGCDRLAVRAEEAAKFATTEPFTYATAEHLLAIDRLAGLSLEWRK